MLTRQDQGDHAAVGLLQILLRNGVRIPEDLSVKGFDDAPSPVSPQ
ncbi:substrate-binding domain-containing protein [Micromonospora sp. CPCC 206061]